MAGSKRLAYSQILDRLKSLSDPEALEGMARFGITPKRAFGVSVPNLRKIAKEAGRDHALALELWSNDTRETRILAAMIGEPDKVTDAQMEEWVREFDYWEICDQVCMNLFDKTPLAWNKAVEWSEQEEEFVKRAAFALVACLAWHDKDANDRQFVKLMPVVKRGATDERQMVKKAVNWALRQIGKRNLALNSEAIAAAREIEEIDSKAARWVAGDAIRELTSDKVQERLGRK